MSLVVAKFSKEQLKDLKHWGYHQDIRFAHYDFKYFKDSDYLRWYNRKQRQFSQWLFAVSEQDKVIGFITMKKIAWVKRQATMGIVFDPNCLSKGLGTRAVGLFLDIFFNQYRFKTLKLEVSDFNRRAMRSYQKNGFVIINTQMRPFESQENAFEIMLKHQGEFSMVKGRLMTLVHDMQIDQARYQQTGS